MKDEQYPWSMMLVLVLFAAGAFASDDTSVPAGSVGRSLADIVSLVEKEGDFDAKLDSEQRTLLILAAAYGDTNVIAECISKGAAVDAADVNGKTALMYACESGNLTSVRLLVSKGADLNHRGGKAKESALILAARNGKESIVKDLAESGAKLDLRDRNGGTAWSRAKAEGHDHIADYLLRNGASRSLILDTANLEAAELAKRELSTVANAMDLWRVAKRKKADDVPSWDDLVGYIRPGDPLAERDGNDVFGNLIILRSCAKGPAIHETTRSRLESVIKTQMAETLFWGKYLQE